MGDRGNIVVRDGNDVVYLYGHWSRESMPRTVLKALRRWQRWGDAPYLARILFCELIGTDVTGETGFGISSKLIDGDETVIVDVKAQTVTTKLGTFSFEDYIK